MICGITLCFSSSIIFLNTGDGFPLCLSRPVQGDEPGLHTATPASGGPRMHLPLDQLHDALCVHEEDLALCLPLQRGGVAVQDGGYLDKNTKQVRPLPTTGSSGHWLYHGGPPQAPREVPAWLCSKTPATWITALPTPSVSPWGPRSSE